MTEIVKYREHLPILINPEGTVDVRVAITVGDDDKPVPPRAMFICVACEAPMERGARTRLIECQECGYEISDKEASRLCNRHAVLVQKLAMGLASSSIQEGWLCRLLMFLGLRKRRI